MSNTSTRKPCTFDGCEKKRFGHGLCSGHYTQWRRGKPLTPLAPRASRVAHLDCTFPGCVDKQLAKGYCEPHYKQKRSGAKMVPISDMRRSATYRDPQGRKWCSACHTYKNEADFTRSARAKDGLEHRCAACMVRKGRDYAASGAKRARNYGMTPAQIASLYEAQEGLCATCYKELPQRFTVDHDHSCCDGAQACGKCVRGLLCHPCNAGLGFVKDNTETLSRMIRYLENPPASTI